jgi:hypothetical protein
MNKDCFFAGCVLLLLQYGAIAMDPSSETGTFKSETVISRDGKFMATSLINGDVHILNVATKHGDIISFPTRVNTFISALAYDRCLAIGYNDGFIRILDENLKEILSFKPFDSAVCCLSFDGNLLAAISEDSCLKIWDISQLACIYTTKTSLIGKLLLVNTERDLLFFVADGSITVKNFKDDREVSLVQSEPNSITAWVLQGDHLWVCSQDQVLRKWNIYSGECAAAIKTCYVFSSLSVSYDGKFVIGASKSGVAFFWDVATGKTIGSIIPKSRQGTMGRYHTAIASCNAVIFATTLCNVLVYRVTGNKRSVLMINELPWPIENIEFYDKSAQALCNQVSSCAPQAHVVFDYTVHDIFSSYKLCLKVAGVAHVIDSISGIGNVRRMVITQSLRDGKLLLMLGRRSTRDSDGLEYTGCRFIAENPWGCRQDERFSLLAYAIGGRLASLFLTDAHNVRVTARSHMAIESREKSQQADQHYGDLGSVVSFENVSPDGPYTLCAETQHARCQWDIPFLSPRAELLLTLAPRLVKLKLYEETTEQFYSVPLKFSESIPAQQIGQV